MEMGLVAKKGRMLGFIDKSFGWMFFWRNRPKKTMRNAGYSISPERTALMSFDDLSAYNEVPHCFMNHTSSSNSESDSVPSPMTSSSGTEIFPPWHKNKDHVTPPMDPKAKEETRKRRSLLYAFHNARIRSLSNVGKTESQDDGDDESTNFSISTDLRHQPVIVEPPPQQLIPLSDSPSNNDTTVTSGKTPPPPPLLSTFRDLSSDHASVRTSRSVQTSRSSRSARSVKSMLGSIGNRSRVSLDQFLEDRTQASSLITGPMLLTTNLGELPADFDAMSVGTSASLDVSFHGEYPQLVLTPSVDGTASRMTGSSLETNTGAVNASMHHKSKNHNALITVGTTDAATPATPSSNHSVASFDTTKRNVLCTPQWLNDNIDRVWKQFDQCKTDPDGRYAPDDDPYDSNYDNDEVDDHLPYNKADPEVNVFRYQFKNGHISDLKANDSDIDDDEKIIKVNSDDSIDFESTEEEENTDDDLDAILDTTIDEEENGDDEEKEEEIKKASNETVEKDDQFSFRSFSPFDDMGWSFSGGSTNGGKSISQMFETEVIYPILKPICELVEATEIPQGRTYHHHHRHHHRHRQTLSGSNLTRSSSSQSPSSDSYHLKNSSYRMSPRRYKSPSTLR